jgi:methylated-DNA-[protein]-cysteine S-methyltransferase
MWFDTLTTPIGTLCIAADAQGLRHIRFEHERHPIKVNSAWQFAPEQLVFARRQLEEYFAGSRRQFDLPLAPVGTPFQLQVWQSLAQIAFGTTWSYQQLAHSVGNAAAARAVGAANGRNPLPIVLPCHRVIGANGALTGFGGGLPIKQWLLEHECGEFALC